MNKLYSIVHFSFLTIFLAIISSIGFAQENTKSAPTSDSSQYISPEENSRKNFIKVVKEVIEKRRQKKLGKDYRPIDWDNTGQSPDERVDENYRKLLNKLIKAFDEAHATPSLKTFTIELPRESIPPH